MSNWWIRSHRNLLLCLILIFSSFVYLVETSRANAYSAIRGIEVSNACFGVDGLDLTANRIKCNSDEKICIWSVDYGVKTVSYNVSCPHAVAHNVHPSCCTPVSNDCIVSADWKRKRDLILECDYLSPFNCLLTVDRLDVKSICTNRPGITFTTFRSITYVCAPNALAEPGEDPCKYLPDKDSTFWDDLKAGKIKSDDPMRSMILAGSGSESATVLIASIIGFSSFLVVFILLMILAVRCTGWMVDPQDDVRKPSEREDNTFSIHNVDFDWKPFHQSYNVYEPYPRFHEHRPPNIVFSSNNEAKASKRFYYQVKHTNTSDDASERTYNPRNYSIGRAKRESSDSSRVTSGRSSPPSYRSRVDTPTSRGHGSADQSDDDWLPRAGSNVRTLAERHRALSIQERFQRMFYGDYFAPRRLQIPLPKSPT